MTTIMQRAYREATVGAIVNLPKSGTQLENRYVFDAAAREVKAMAELGRVKIVDERRESQHDGAPSRLHTRSPPFAMGRSGLGLQAWRSFDHGRSFRLQWVLISA